MNWFNNKEDTTVADLAETVASLTAEIDRLGARKDLLSENEDLRAQVLDKQLELARLEQKRKMEEEDIKHLVRITTEKSELEVERKTVELEGAKAEAISKVKDEYQDKLTKTLEKQITDTQKMFSDILTRLPSVTAHIGDATHKTVAKD